MTTGTTTSQMLNAPLNAIYIWCNANVSYPKALAKHLGRDDLEIVGPIWLSSDGWHGRRLSGVVVDHCTSLSVEQSEVLEYLRAYRINVDEPESILSFCSIPSHVPEFRLLIAE